MIIKHKIDILDGDIDIEELKLACSGNQKYGRVDLCFDFGCKLAFARIILHSRDRATDADAVYLDAMAMGNETARRWNEHQKLSAEVAAVAAVRDQYASTICERNATINKQRQRIAELESALAESRVLRDDLWRALKQKSEGGF
jgi:hypothetical protein